MNRIKKYLKAAKSSYSIAFVSLIIAVIAVACESSGGGSGGGNGSSSSSVTVKKFIAISAGGYHTLALNKDNSVWAFGRNTEGQLGLGNNTDSNKIQQITSLGNSVSAISAGAAHSLVIKNDGTLWSFGSNGNGELGLNNIANSNTPKQVTFSNKVDNDVIAIAAGGASNIGFSLALKKNGTVWSFGNNSLKQLGIRNNNNLVPTLIPNLTEVVAIAARTAHALVLKKDGTVLSFGDNGAGQLGLGNTRTIIFPSLIPVISDIKAIAAGNAYSLLLRDGDGVMAFGLNRFGQLGLTSDQNTPIAVHGLSDITAITASHEHSLVLKKDGTVLAFGFNKYGQLGLGNNVDTKSPTTVTDLSNDVSAISAGGSVDFVTTSETTGFTIALKNDGTIWSFGNNIFGQLGLGNNDNTNTPTKVNMP